METESSVTVQWKMDFKKILTFFVFSQIWNFVCNSFSSILHANSRVSIVSPYFKEINECIYDNGGCVHFCQNTKGNYTCSCKNGFELDSDGQNCIGEYFFIFCYLIYFHLVFTFKKVIEIDAGIFTINFYNVNVFTRGTHIYLDNGASLLILCSQLKMQRCVQFFADKNECLQNKGGCHHQCLNTLGGYECKCNAGYSLSKDGRSCQCKS